MPFFLGKAVKHSEDGKRAANDEEVRNAGKLDPRRIPRSNPLILLDDHYGCNLEQPSVCLVFFVCICVGLLVGNHNITVSAKSSEAGNSRLRGLPNFHAGKKTKMWRTRRWWKTEDFSKTGVWTTRLVTTGSSMQVLDFFYTQFIFRNKLIEWQPRCQLDDVTRHMIQFTAGLLKGRFFWPRLYL